MTDEQWQRVLRLGAFKQGLLWKKLVALDPAGPAPHEPIKVQPRIAQKLPPKTVEAGLYRFEAPQ